MTCNFAAVIVLLAWPLWALAAESATSDVGLAPGMVNPGYHEQPAWFKNSFLDLREDIAEARAGDKRVLLFFYQDGCPYCQKLLETNFALRDIEAKTRAGFEVIALNIWGDREVIDMHGQTLIEKQFASQLKVMFTPTLLFLDETGAVVLRLNGYYPPHQFKAALDYASSPTESTRQSFRDYLRQHDPVAAQGKLHQDARYLQAPYRFDKRTGGRPLAVFFEQADCAACDELHLDILKRPESQTLLAKFDVALLDMWTKMPLTTPDGQATTATQWARALNVQYAPTLVLFDADGREVFRTEAYLKAFHMQTALDYVASGVYKEQSNFQRYVQARADALRARGIPVDIMQ
ncbi:MAG: thioredoxin fold domain-containing protein [Gammaproteobacteria bacterium]|nr:thioredoxin fold domain-containing protein [Gammaproteobacteria bacterium]